MSASIMIEQAGEERRIEAQELPIVIGGPESDIAVSGGQSEVPLAFVGLEQGEPFLQPATAITGILCNGDPIATSKWLRGGDLIRIGPTEISVIREPDLVRLRVEKHSRDVDTEPPVIVATPVSTSAVGSEIGPTVTPVEFQPKPIRRASTRRWSWHPWLVVTWIVLALLGAAAWFLFTARVVELRVLPQPDELTVVGRWMRLEIGGRYLLRPGKYTLAAGRAGYRPLQTDFQVSDLPSQVYEFELEKLPGLLQVNTIPAAGVSVAVDGEARGTTPLAPIELPPGEHTVVLSAGRFEPVSHTVELEGGGETFVLQAELSPRWAPVTIESSPAGAAVRIDGGEVGLTPLTTEILEGKHELEIRLAGYKTQRSSLNVLAQQPYTHPLIVLAPADGVLNLTSAPSEATVTVDGAYRGLTPLELDLEPNMSHQVSLSKSGHDTASDVVRLASGESRQVHVDLDPRIGKIEISVEPGDAVVTVDGEQVDTTAGPLKLTAVPHLIEAHKQGHESYRQSLTPQPGFPQRVEIHLRTEAEAQRDARPAVLRTSQGQEMRWIGPGKLRMGASRREPGRRANEVLRDVEITRGFYLATEEVSNEEYREFREDHRSGQAGGKSLDLDDYPVVSVTWDEAARYCNWLSAKEGLPKAYREENGRVITVRPLSTGYRLPTEAEWAWAARFAGNAAGRKYPWGDSLPIPDDFGNYADASAAGIVEATIEGYRDDFAVTAPVDSFAANAVGIFNLGGNVAEWVNDVYSVNPAGSGGPEIDPLGPEEGEYHVIRGSGWMDSTVTELRLSFRDYGNQKRPDVGFRIARYTE